ncbi:MAG: hypothetical protein SLAVMIC_01001 [uncultured marine phage]|uniref:Uncharacterized protein n=1 Tax=uncultured marine phage TaxID=707152 RepID=A0A8D9FRK0_9VIRU|nr:MAG: hypothetical protein SLAVMIC_01001 [uncultured marine phage]
MKEGLDGFDIFLILIGSAFVLLLLTLLVRYFLIKMDEDYFEKSIIPHTKFLYEDGKIYYFRIYDRDGNSYRKIKCYKKTKLGFYKSIGDYELIDATLGSRNIKKECKQILESYNAKLGDFDGMVGNIPDWVKREQRFKKLFKDK